MFQDGWLEDVNYADEMSHGKDEIKKIGKILGYDRCWQIFLQNLVRQ